jgi:hypothetical protein
MSTNDDKQQAKIKKKGISVILLIIVNKNPVE